MKQPPFPRWSEVIHEREYSAIGHDNMPYVEQYALAYAKRYAAALQAENDRLKALMAGLRPAVIRALPNLNPPDPRDSTTYHQRYAQFHEDRMWVIEQINKVFKENGL